MPEVAPDVAPILQLNSRRNATAAEVSALSAYQKLPASCRKQRRSTQEKMFCNRQLVIGLCPAKWGNKTEFPSSGSLAVFQQWTSVKNELCSDSKRPPRRASRLHCQNARPAHNTYSPIILISTRFGRRPSNSP